VEVRVGGAVGMVMGEEIAGVGVRVGVGVGIGMGMGS
jgi:hypothetical protein